MAHRSQMPGAYCCSNTEPAHNSKEAFLGLSHPCGPSLRSRSPLALPRGACLHSQYPRSIPQDKWGPESNETDRAGVGPPFWLTEKADTKTETGADLGLALHPSGPYHRKHRPRKELLRLFPMLSTALSSQPLG